MRAQIVLTHITGARLHVANLRPRSQTEPNACADRVRVGACTAQANKERIRTIGPPGKIVPQQLRVLPVVGDEEVEVAVVVDVADGEAAADALGGKRRPGHPADFTKSPIPQIPE
jgi:hypothetical protein